LVGCTCFNLLLVFWGIGFWQFGCCLFVLSSNEWWVATLLCFIFGMLIMMLLAAAVAVRRDALVSTIRLEGTLAQPELTLALEQKYHLFCSHTWSTGQDQVATIKRQLQRMLPGVRVFLDVDDLNDVSKLETYIQQTNSMLLFLTKSFFLSGPCLREVKATLDQEKPFLLVHEADISHGGAPLDELIDELKDDQQRAKLFRNRNQAIRWQRIAAFQVVSLTQIVQQMLANTPAYWQKSLALVVPGTLVEQKLDFPRRVVLYASKNNPNAKEVADELAGRFPSLSVTEDGARLSTVVRIRTQQQGMLSLRIQRSMKQLGRGPITRNSCGGATEVTGPLEVVEAASSTTAGVHAGGEAVLGPQRAGGSPSPEPTHFLLYLSQRTFLEGAGTALAGEVRAALDAGLPIAMIHEKDETHQERCGCAFYTFFKTTPQDLIERGLYTAALAIAFEGDRDHRVVSHKLFAQSIGAVKNTLTRRIRRSRSRFVDYWKSLVRSSLGSGRVSVASRLRGRSSDLAGRV